MELWKLKWNFLHHSIKMYRNGTLEIKVELSIPLKCTEMELWIKVELSKPTKKNEKK